MAHTFLQYIRLKMLMKEPHAALFIAPTRVGNTHLALNLFETEYRNHFDFIVVICPLQAITLHMRVEVGFGMILMSFLKNQTTVYTI